MGCCQIMFFVGMLLYGMVSSEKVYLRDLDKDSINITSLWNIKTCPGYTGWYSNTDPLKPKELKFNVCFSLDCKLETFQFGITGINTVFADFSLTGRYCGAKEPAQCTEFIEVGANLGDTRIVNPSRYISTEPWLQIPSAQDTKSRDSVEFFKVSGVVAMENKGNKYISYVFNSKFFCGALQSFVVYYFKCPAVTESLLTFGEHNAPNKTKGVEVYNGKCVENAVKVTGSDPKLKCMWDGTAEITGSCQCASGYQKDQKMCKKCDVDRFKPGAGNEECTKCGANSIGNHDRTTCKCREGFFREKGKDSDYTSKCYGLPPKPSSVSPTNITASSAIITWKHSPDIKGTYILSCRNCPKEDKVFPMSTSATSIEVEGLGAFATYELILSFENQITNDTGKSVTTEFTFTTLEGVPGPVQNMRQKTLSDGSVELSWDAPFAKGSDRIVYLITYGNSKKTTTSNTFIIESDTQTRSYNVKIAAQVSVNGVVLTGISNAYQEEITVKGDGVPLELLIGGIIGAVIFVIIVLLIAFLLWKRKNPPYTQVVRMEDGTVKLPGRFYPGAKLYVDPTTYNDVDEAVQEFAYEIEATSLKIGKLLGGGEFADVYKGSLFKNGKSKDVAIKTLKPNASKRDRDDFLSEAAIIGQFTDPNVISLEGVVLRERPHKIVLEFMANGALDKYLQNHDNEFTSLQLLGMARGVASGMKYLNELGFIHRDLAARNILVDGFRVCKVSDFGMSREIKVDETYDTQGGKIPVRWTAPESIQYKKFTTASDVWSYGILLWEIMSYGERPYWDWGNYEVLERLNQGYRLPPPMNCPKVVHDLMLHCWSKDRTKRPKMVEIRDQLEKWIRSPDLLETTASVVTKTDENLDYTVLQTINKWLDAIGMAKYTENFNDQGFATPRQILDLTLDDLEGLGIAPIGHRKKIFKAIQNTKAQVEQRHNSMSGRKKTFSLPKKSGSTT